MKRIVLITPAEIDHSSPLATPPLTEPGRFRASELSTSIDSSFDLVLYMPIPGARQTARLVADHESAPDQELVVPRGLATSMSGRALASARQDLGDASLAEYFRQGKENAVMGAAYRYHRNITKAIESSGSSWTLIVADHILVSSLAILFAKHLPLEKFAERKLSPGQGYMFTKMSDRSKRFSVTEL